MTKKDLIVIVDSAQDDELSLQELCNACQVRLEIIKALVDHGVISPQKGDTDQWQFNLAQMRRVRMALRIAHDFELDYDAVALVLDLLEQMQMMRSRIEFLEKHFSK